jgi:general L-amino acid transport system permease protein
VIASRGERLAPLPPTGPIIAPRRIPPWRDVRYLTWTFQAAVVGAIIALILWLRKNLSDNGWDLDYGYLDRQAGFPIADSDFRPTQSVADALKEGLANTGRLVVSGIVLATVLGTLIGIARLSQNFIMRTAAQWYVEVVRNIPLYAVFVLMYSGVALTYLPHPRDPLDWSPIVVANTRGVAIPWYEASNWRFVIVVVVVLIVVVGAFKVATGVRDRTGAAIPTLTTSLGAGAIALVACWLVLDLGFTTPALQGPRPVDGIKMTPPFFAALAALVIYTSSHIAEIVRGSIQAVSKGQSEAANALALSGAQRLRFVVLPQAMRIALPSIGNQYLNLAKNSSLAVVVTFPELTKVTRLATAQGAPTVASTILLLGIYLCISLALSLIVNGLNRKLRIVER